MKKVLSLVLGVMLVAAMAAFNPVSARGPMAGGPGGGMMGPQGEFWGAPVLEKLNLTPEQTAKVANMREEVFKEVAPLKEKIFSKRNELKGLWLQATPDEAKINAVQKELRELRGQLQERITKFRLEVGKLLTPEQRDKLRAGFAGPGPGSRWAERCRMAAPRGTGEKKGMRQPKN